MIEAKELDGELWIKAADYHKAVKVAVEHERPTQEEPVACKECHLKDLVYDLLGELKVANLKLSVRAKRTWVGLTDDAEIFAISNTMPYANRFEFARAIEAKLKEKNT